MTNAHQRTHCPICLRPYALLGQPDNQRPDGFCRGWVDEAEQIAHCSSRAHAGDLLKEPAGQKP